MTKTDRVTAFFEADTGNRALTNKEIGRILGVSHSLVYTVRVKVGATGDYRTRTVKGEPQRVFVAGMSKNPTLSSLKNLQRTVGDSWVSYEDLAGTRASTKGLFSELHQALKQEEGDQ